MFVRRLFRSFWAAVGGCEATALRVAARIWRSQITTYDYFNFGKLVTEGRYLLAVVAHLAGTLAFASLRAMPERKKR